MRFLVLCGFTFAAALSFASSCVARPIAYSGAGTAMFEYGDTMREAQLYYASKYWYSGGAVWHRMTSDDGRIEREVTLLRGNLLARRWNLDAAQANVFVWGGVGRARSNSLEGSESATNAGFQFDYETLRVYANLRSDWVHSDAFVHRVDRVQFGLAPYVHRYGGWATWVVAQAQRKSGELSEGVENSLLLRFFNETFWIDAGLTEDGEPEVMLMINF
jgi:hypothetical protein